MSKFNPERVFTKTWSMPQGWSLKAFESTGGYQGLRKALSMEPDAITQVVLESNLRGRGGAGFPTGRKWSFVPKNDKPKYLAVNGDESEPGTFKDRYILEKSPHMLIEGIAIACRAFGAHQAYIYLRGEFGLAMRRMEAAIEEAYAAGILGPSVMGSGYRLDCAVHRGAGAYICGEETALLESLEGRKGQPRLKPPFPAVEGLWASPTVVNNIETLAAVGPIVLKGPDWWKGLSTSTCQGGTKLMGISGHVARPGVYEVGNGITMRELIYDVGGGMRNPDRPLKAVIPGGSSCKIITADEIDVPYDIDGMKQVDSMMGTGCPTVIEEGTCIVRVLKRIERFYAHESCGQCSPCREGGDWLYKLLSRIEAGQGTLEDVDRIESIASHIEGHTICPFGEALAWPARSYLKKFRDEFIEHVKLGRCPYGEIPVAPIAVSGAIA